MAELERETTRLEAFSDGVFAIAVTLLILELHVPLGKAGSGELLRALADDWPTYLAFTLSFATILIMWLNHHALFLWVVKPDGPIFVANGVLLLTITVVPFTTALLGDYLGAPGARAAAAIYAGHLVAINLAFTWLWRTISRRRTIVAPRLDQDEVNLTNRYLAFSLLAYLAAVALAAWSAAASVTLTLLLAAFWTWNAYRRLRAEPSAAA